MARHAVSAKSGPAETGVFFARAICTLRWHEMPTVRPSRSSKGHMTFGSVIVGESSATVCGSDIQRQELLISMLDARIAFARRDRGPIEGMRPRDLFRATAHRVTDSGVKEFAAITAIPHRRVQVLIAAMKANDHCPPCRIALASDSWVTRYSASTQSPCCSAKSSSRSGTISFADTWSAMS